MKLKEGFITHNDGDTQIMVASGNVRFDGLVRSNKTAAYIVDCLKTETTENEIVEKMLMKYDAPRDVIEADVKKIIDTLRSVGAIDE